jgi:general secretion pathway protein A
MEEAKAYLEFFGLKEQPFAPTADPIYFYATRGHRECLFRLWNSIDERHGIAVVLGNYGTGKTTLLRKLLTGMTNKPDKYCTAVLGSPIPSWTSFALLESIVAQFGLRPREHAFVAYMEALNRYLLENRHRICTLIIDDAQNLNKRGQLELLRLVQNLETQQHKLLNLVLFAQLEWIPVLEAAPNFAQRVNLTFTLEPLGFQEARHLIEFRLFQAAGDPARAPRFEEGALEQIYRHAQGSPRVLVTLCRNTLLVAAQLGNRTVTRDIVTHTIEKTTLPGEERRGRLRTAPMPPEVVQTTRPAAPARPAPPASQEDLQRERMTRDQRAAQLLLRASQDRDAGNTE